MSIPPPAYYPTSPTRIPRPTTTQQPARYKPTIPIRNPPPALPRPPSTLQPVTYYKPTTPAPNLPLPIKPFSPSGAVGKGLGALSKLVPKVLGPIGAVAGFLLFPDSLSPDQGNVPQPAEPPQYVEPPIIPFSGGQEVCTQYNVTIRSTSDGVNYDQATTKYFGPIVSLEVVKTQRSDGLFRTEIYLTSGGFVGFEPCKNPPVRALIGNRTGTNPSTNIVKIEKIPNGTGPDSGGDPPPLNNPYLSAPGNPLAPAIPAPPSRAPVPAPKAPPLIAPTPAPFNPNPDKEQPKKHPGPAPTPNPGSTPQPTKYPDPISPAPDFFPTFDPSPTPGVGTGSPNPAPIPPPGLPKIKEPIIKNPRIEEPNLPIVGNPFLPNPLPPPAPFTPNILKPNPLTPNTPTPAPFRPNPGTGNPEPKAPPIPITPNTPTPEKTPFDQFRDDINKYLGPIAIGIAGITGLVQPEKLREAANAATCEAFAPGGCNAPIANNAASAAANSANNATGIAAIMSFLQAIQTLFLIPIKAGVELVNTKLGPLMAGVGGIGGFLGRLSKSLGVDRALNLITFAANLHNAMMLSANLKITLLEMLSSVGNATGLLQTSENENVDLNQVFNAGIETFLISILGVESYAGLKVGLRKYNAIYQAATNSLNAVSSMFNSLGNVVEQGAEYTGRIGNALKGAGMVGENAYRWMSEKFDAKSNKFIKFQSTIGDVTQVLETINEIAETVVEGQQAATEFQKANTDFIKAVEEAKKGTPPENKEVLAEATKAKENATKDPTGELEEGLLSFLTN